MKAERIIVLLVFGVIIYFPIFLHLDYGGLYRWDEATNALHAYDMLENGNYLRRFFLGQPETWETKPPLLVWLQAISMKLFGYNELAVRLPSALAVLMTIILIFRVFTKELNDFWGGLFSGIVLLTSSGYVRGHVSRTGDHDALLILFLVGGLVFFYKYLFGDPDRKWCYYVIFVLCLIGGVMTKSIAGLYYAPGLLLFTLVSKKFVPILKERRFWFGVLAFFLVIGGYYGIVEYFYPGYLKVVWDGELLPRFFNNAEGHNYHQMPEPYHFTKVLFTNNFKWYIWLVPLSIYLIWNRKGKRSSFLLLVFVTAIIFHLVSSNGTYNSWYNAPIFPLLAMIVGAGLSFILNSLIKYFSFEGLKKYTLWVLFTFAIFVVPYKEIIQTEVYFKDYRASDEVYGEYFKKLREEQPDLKDFFVYYEVVNRHFLFYRNVYNDKLGFNIQSCGNGPNISKCKPEKTARSGNKVMICNDHIKKSFDAMFVAKEFDSYKECVLYKVISVRPEE